MTNNKRRAADAKPAPTPDSVREALRGASPRLLAAVMEMVRSQRPDVRLDAIDRNVSAWRDFLREPNVLEALGIGPLPELRSLEASAAMGDALERRIERMRPNPTASGASSARKAVRDVRNETVPIAAFSLRDPGETFCAYLRALVETLPLSAAGRAWYLDKSTMSWHVERFSGRRFREGMHPCGVRLLRLGFVEIKSRKYAEALRSLPPGAEPAGSELIAALLAYPGILAWARLHPRGGRREGETFRLWMPGTSALDPSIADPELDHLIFGSDPAGDGVVLYGVERFALFNASPGCDLLAYVLPVEHVEPGHLLAEAERGPA